MKAIYDKIKQETEFAENQHINPETLKHYVEEWNAAALRREGNFLAIKEENAQYGTGNKDKIQKDIDQKEKACNGLRSPVATRAAA